MLRRAYARARAQVSGRSESGAAALEFALVAPLLIALLIGIISYGYMLSFRQGISQSAAEGARAAAVSSASQDKTAAARQAVNNSLNSYGVTCSTSSTLVRDGKTVGTCNVTIAACTGSSGRDCAYVRVNYAYRDNPLLPSFPGLGATLPANLDYEAVAEVSS